MGLNSKLQFHKAFWILLSCGIFFGVMGAAGGPTVHAVAPASAESSFRFISWGDAHDEPLTLAAAAGQVAALNPAFAIFNGDLENSGVRLRWMDTMTSAMGVMYDKTFLVRGNHDTDVKASAALWEDYFTAANRPLPAGVTNYAGIDSNSTFLTYSFDYGNARFIAVDVPGYAELLTSTQASFIDSRLTDAEAAGLTHAFIYFHGPIYCVESIHCSCSASNDASCTPPAIIDLINRHPIVSATFHGHEHILGWTHMDETRVSAITHSYEQFLTSPTSNQNYNDYVFPARLDYYYPDMTDSEGFAAVDVNGSSFTFSIYKVGITAPVWSKTFDKSSGPTATSTSTSTPTATSTETPAPTATPTLTATPTSTPTLTAISTEVVTAAPTATSTVTPTYAASSTATPTATSTMTATYTATSTMTASPTSTLTATPTATRTKTPTPSATETGTATSTPTATRTPTPTATSTATPTSTSTSTPTPSSFTISGSVGVANGTLTYTDGTVKTVAADDNGAYLLTVPADWSGTVVPSKTGYTFSPGSRIYSHVMANEIGENFVAALIDYSLSVTSAHGIVNRDGLEPYHYGDVVLLSAVPDLGWSFANWSGDVSGTANPVLLTITGDKTVTANYNPISYTIFGNAGAPGVTLSYTGGSVIADEAGNYSFIVSYGWSGTVVPSKAGYLFAPASRAYSGVLMDLTAENYTAYPLVAKSYQASGAQDGWILESRETSGLGGTMDSTATTLRLGDDVSRRQYRVILSFNTASLPDRAVITSARLGLRRQSVAPPRSDPFSIFQALLIDIRRGFFGSSAGLQAADFQATGMKTMGPFQPIAYGAVYAIDLPITAYPYINKLTSNSGLTQMRLRFKLDDNNNATANFVSFFSGNYGTASYRPVLVITYYVP